MDENKNLDSTPERTEQDQTEPAANEPATKKGNHRKGWMIFGIVVAVVVVLVIAGVIWHNQPSFCSAMCHTPMDTYYESYASDSSTALAKAHADAGYTCLDCHEAKLSEQMTEGLAYVTNNLNIDQDGYLLDSDVNVDGDAICLSCHTKASIVAMTVDFEGNTGYNVHDNHQVAQDGLDCESCHSMHGTQTLSCTGCHDLNVPEGWESVNE